MTAHTTPVFFRPPEGWVGDVIPYHWRGEFWLFYLHETRSGRYDAGMSWHLARTRDFVTYDYAGEVLRHGGPEDQDLHAYTGCVIEAAGEHHLFYTGYNPAFRDKETGQPLQAVMHAVSSDLLTWRKIPADTFYAPGDRHEPADWRDPFVYPTPGGEGYTMLLAARTKSGPERRRGCVARAVSPDLSRWTVTEPFSAPARFLTHECPDLFELDGRWYLVYSEFSEKFTVRYRVGDGPEGPWRAPADDTLDGRAYYAAKTAAGDDGRRYAFGWIPTRLGLRDDGAWEWAGDLAVHELTARPDGTLDVRLPATVREAFGAGVPEAPGTPVTGDWRLTGEGADAAVETADAPATLRLGELPPRCLVTATVRFAPGTRECGLILRGAEDLDEGYFVRLEPTRGRLVFDRWPRTAPGPQQWHIAGDVPHALELERPAALDPDVPHELTVLIDDSAAVAYLDGAVAMSFRMYDRRTGCLGLFVGDGSAEFTDVSVRTRQNGAA
ncbi:GH32 C-terminal domain-containing protein [Streptomyces sp. NBC_01803]|uniref:GH32 C-terminal domain-containing protein n=1 Tax=Streptomyces sp. NBC_01803 TaxID=2975946 RepID=UPI002DD7DBC5|nr:GH32 C-terminal domain-containing protein [Streptomyces sp. NBC_01803]WSA43659.1 GH32 C-terminal domain-containing protein [Streptomyces sp. NBC_01803]